ncbi:hypothetical protein C943_00736 [Mariniradius saccharolyticus AK6]|uniref:Uncharacterized protein n=1 Tax=Mariniradius saccharolyticus AK6 TaxID=1239962 RepID=M7Y660_9BACT|nr:hypothetical protein C943_00736 [Mariniradius saccharolyticus AK6]
MNKTAFGIFFYHLKSGTKSDNTTNPPFFVPQLCVSLYLSQKFHP